MHVLDSGFFSLWRQQHNPASWNYFLTSDEVFVCLKRQVTALGNTHISPLWRHHWRASAMVHIQFLRKLVSSSFRRMWTAFFGLRHSITLMLVLMVSVFIPWSLWCSKWNFFANTYSKMFSSPPLAIPLPCQIFIGQKKRNWNKSKSKKMNHQICNTMREKKPVTEDQWQGFQISCFPIWTNIFTIVTCLEAWNGKLAIHRN